MAKTRRRQKSTWEKIDGVYPRILRLVGMAAMIVGITLVTAGNTAGSAIVGAAGSLITAGISAEALKKKDDEDEEEK